LSALITNLNLFRNYFSNDTNEILAYNLQPRSAVHWAGRAGSFGAEQ